MIEVLIADDDPDLRALCHTILSGEGFSVLEAVNAAQCITLTRERQPNLVLLDWMMPDLSGIDALRVLKGSEPTRDVPVVMVTALERQVHIAEATEAGADGYLTKPFEAESLLAMVRRLTELEA